MSTLPKVTLFFLLGAASLHQGEGMVSWKPVSWSPLNGFRHPNALQGTSSLGLTIWNDFHADTMWPSFSHSVFKTHPNRAIQVADQGSWVKMEDGNDEVQNKFDCEEQQLQLKEGQLRKEWQNLNARRDGHKRQEEQKRLQEQERLNQIQQHERMKREGQLRQPKIQQRKIQELDQAKREAQFHQEKIFQQRQRKEKQRLEEQNRIQRERQKQEAQRQDEIRLREERKRLEKQRLVERERQEQMRKEKELERKRVTEERARDARQRQQEEAQRQRQIEEMRRQRERDSTRQSNLPKSEIGKLSIPEGYNLEDISIKVVGNQAFVKGYHRCRCHEKCYEREFERRLPVPKNVDTRTVTASLYPDGQLKLRGVRFRQNILPIETEVVVEGVGLTPKMEHDSCSKFSKNKSGFKLKKMNARTGEIFEDVALFEDTYPRYESEIDEDGLTIEVVE